jgi:hypothetical protein
MPFVVFARSTILPIVILSVDAAVRAVEHVVEPATFAQRQAAAIAPGTPFESPDSSLLRLKPRELAASQFL